MNIKSIVVARFSDSAGYLDSVLAAMSRRDSPEDRLMMEWVRGLRDKLANLAMLAERSNEGENAIRFAYYAAATDAYRWIEAALPYISERSALYAAEAMTNPETAARSRVALYTIARSLFRALAILNRYPP